MSYTQRISWCVPGRYWFFYGC